MADVIIALFLLNITSLRFSLDVVGVSLLSFGEFFKFCFGLHRLYRFFSLYLKDFEGFKGLFRYIEEIVLSVKEKTYQCTILRVLPLDCKYNK